MCFFFSSRRRHTRCSRDWSSDVCSSDLLFYGQDGEACVRCAITREALDDHFHGDGKDKLEVFRANRQPVEKEVQRRYLAGDTELDGSILIRSSDLPS